MMKQLLCILAFGIFFNLAASLQYSRIEPNDGTGVSLQSSADISIKILSSTLTTAKFTAFGYYTMDAENNILEKRPLSFAEFKDGVISLGSFNSGATIGFWAVNSQGEILDSVYRAKEQGKSRPAAYVSNNSGGSPVIITMGTITQTGFSAEPESAVNSNNLTFEVLIGSASDGGGSSEQPLPGSVASLLMGGVILLGGIIYTRNQKRKKRLMQIQRKESFVS